MDLHSATATSSLSYGAGPTSLGSPGLRSEQSSSLFRIWGGIASGSGAGMELSFLAASSILLWLTRGMESNRAHSKRRALDRQKKTRFIFDGILSRRIVPVDETTFQSLSAASPTTHRLMTRSSRLEKAAEQTEEGEQDKKKTCYTSILTWLRNGFTQSPNFFSAARKK